VNEHTFIASGELNSDELTQQQKGITLKALANASPGFALKPWVQKTCEWRRNSFRVASLRNECMFPRVAKAQTLGWK
jgi:hypothetical protein